MSERQWHYALNGQQFGPFPESHMMHWFQTGALKREQVHVWTEGMAQWSLATTVEALRAPAGGPVAAGAAVQQQAAAQAPQQNQAQRGGQPQQAQGQASGFTLAYSELAVLCGEQLAPKTFAGISVDLPHTDAKANVGILSEHMATVAILGLEQQGAIRLEHVPKKAMLGLTTVQEVFMVWQGGANPWPHNSFEAAMMAMVAQSGRKQVNTALADYLVKDSGNPNWTFYQWAVAAMAERGLLVGETEKKMAGLFKVTKYHVPPQTAAILPSQPFPAMRQLLQSAQQGRPDLYKALLGEVKRAFAFRTESSDTGGGGDY